MLTPAVDVAGPLIVGALAPPLSKNGLPDWHLPSGSAQDNYSMVSWLADVFPSYLSALTIYSRKATPNQAEDDESRYLSIQTVSGVVAFLNTKNVAEDTDGLSAVIAAGLGLYGGVAGAGVYGAN
jgi:hypothetical protein